MKLFSNPDTVKKVKKFPIKAAMQFMYNGRTKNNKMSVVGYKWVEFTFNKHGQLISEKEIKRTFK